MDLEKELSKHTTDTLLLYKKILQASIKNKKRAIARIVKEIVKRNNVEAQLSDNNDFKKPCPNMSNHFRYDDSQGEYCPICRYTMNKGKGFIKS